MLGGPTVGAGAPSGNKPLLYPSAHLFGAKDFTLRGVVLEPQILNIALTVHTLPNDGPGPSTPCCCGPAMRVVEIYLRARATFAASRLRRVPLPAALAASGLPGLAGVEVVQRHHRVVSLALRQRLAVAMRDGQCLRIKDDVVVRRLIGRHLRVQGGKLLVNRGDAFLSVVVPFFAICRRHRTKSAGHIIAADLRLLHFALALQFIRAHLPGSDLARAFVEIADAWDASLQQGRSLAFLCAWTSLV